MFGIDLPLWLRIIVWMLRVLAHAEPPKNGFLDEDPNGE
jgi:hypothetical protein